MQSMSSEVSVVDSSLPAARKLFGEHQRQIAEQTDRLFAMLMGFQWLVAIFISLWISPKTWTGAASRVHPHVWAAIFLGGAISLLPVVVALKRPGVTSTRYLIAVAQMLMGALLIHLTGGRIETHFHVFGSLAFLAFYRDWKVLIPATMVVGLDHVLRGMYFPESIYGVLTASNWRWIEHAAWVVFEDVFLVIACLRGRKEIWQIAKRTAQLRTSQTELDERVRLRTAELRLSEERHRELFENATDAVYVHDLEGRYVSVNRAAEELVGCKRGEIIGRHFAEFIPPELITEPNENFVFKLINRGQTTYELEMLSKDGRRVPVEVNSRLIYEGNVAVGVQGMARDITERKREEAERRVISEIVQGVVTTSDVDELLHLIHRSISEILPAENCYVALYEKKTGLLKLPLCIDKYDPPAPSMKLGKGLTAYVFRTGRSMLGTRESIRALIDEGEVELIGTLPAVWLGIPLKTPSETVGVLVVQHYEDSQAYGQRDVEFLTSVGGQLAMAIERKRGEDALRDSEEKYRTILEQMEDGYFEIDLRGNYVFLNDAFCRVADRSANELLGENYKRFFTPNLNQKLYEAYESVHQTGKALKAFEYELVRKDGTTIFVEESVSLKRDIAGQPIGFMGIRRDCTERKKIEAELEKARDVALESARLKSEFLANMSHEIRTPMNGVIGMTGLLFDTNLDDEQREFAETIRASGDALLTIINDILDFSKIEAGRLHFEVLDFDLCHAVETTVEMLAERAGQKGIELASLVHSDVPSDLRGDPGRLRQVLTNLIGNAVKFTERGEVVVRVTKETETEDKVMIRFTVRDTGIGISKAAQGMLFQAFTQADGSTTRKYGGTGLGLAISKQLVELMNGRIGVDSRHGEGSTFWFTAEFTRQPESLVAQRRPKRASLDHIRTLIVDDNATNRQILSHQLTSWRSRYDEADSGIRALELLRSAAAEGKPYDLAILDLMMPVMDGFELARRIKSDSQIAGVKLVLLTSFGQRGDAATARESGFAAYLTKPVRQSQLFDCLADVISEPIDPSAVSSLLTPSSLLTKHSLNETDSMQHKLILLAEDNIVNQRVALRQLEKLGYRADAVANGREAIEALERIPYDLVFMDCQMPELDGYEATAEIRRLEGTNKHTPIVAMTAHALEGDREKCLAAGMDDYISKPVRTDELARLLERVFSQCAEVVRTNALAATLPAKLPPPVDTEHLHDVMGEELSEILDLYLAETSRNLAKLANAIQTDDIREVDLIAHNCAGTSANCGMLAVVPAFRQLEKAGRDGCLDNAPAFLEEANLQFARICSFLETEVGHRPMI